MTAKELKDKLEELRIAVAEQKVSENTDTQRLSRNLVATLESYGWLVLRDDKFATQRKALEQLIEQRFCEAIDAAKGAAPQEISGSETPLAPDVPNQETDRAVELLRELKVRLESEFFVLSAPQTDGYVLANFLHALNILPPRLQKHQRSHKKIIL